MRQIKFRAYDGMDWVYSETIAQDGNDESLWWILDQNDEWLVCTEPQQFTGLYDMKGNEIYDGDIFEKKLTGSKFEIYYSDISACFRVKRLHDRWNFDLKDIFSEKDCEVISDIHDDKELLK